MSLIPQKTRSKNSQTLHKISYTGGINLYKLQVVRWIPRNAAGCYITGHRTKEEYFNWTNRRPLFHRFPCHTRTLNRQCTSWTHQQELNTLDSTWAQIETPKPWKNSCGTKATLYTKAFHQTPMNRREAVVLYCLCFIPALTYPFPATWLPDTFFEKIHQLSTSTILNKMGYHHTLPWEMVFALRSVGGIGLCHLQHEMEVQQILMLLWHMRARMPLGTTIKILMRQYQLWAGIQQPILTNTQPCLWVPDKQISRLWQTLHKNNIKISYDEWTILPLQKYNVYIMEAIVDLGLSLSQLEQINACHMFLQVTTLAKMTDHMGTHILPQVLNKRGDTNPLRLDGISQSTLTWPRVCNPTTQTWNFWMQMICSLFTGSVMNTRLRHPLGEWTTNYDMCCFWKRRLASPQRLLNQRQPGAMTRVALLIQSNWCQMTFSATIPSNQEFSGTPVTPTDRHQWTISLPIIEVATPILKATPRMFTSFMDQFQQNLEQWQHPLFGPICKCQPTSTAHSHWLTNDLLSLVSNASVQKNK